MALDPEIPLGFKFPEIQGPAVWQQNALKLREIQSLEQERQMRAQQIQFQQQQMQQAQAAQQRANQIVAQLPRDQNGEYDVGAVMQSMASANLPLDHQEKLSASIEGINKTIRAAKQAKMEHLADLANAALQGHGPEDPVTADTVHLTLAAGKLAGIANDEDEQWLVNAIGQGANPEQILKGVRSLGSKWAKPETFEHAPAGSVIYGKEGGNIVATIPESPHTQAETAALQARVPLIEAQTEETKQKAAGNVPLTPYQQQELKIRQQEVGLSGGRLALEQKKFAQEQGSNIEIKPGSREYRTAQDLANGALTMTDFQRLYGRAQANAPLKSAIYDTARQLNPEFNPAQFELGFKMAGNPQIRRQIVAINSLSPLIDRVQTLVSQVNPTDIPAANRLIQAAEFQLGGEKVADLRQLQRLLGDEAGVALGVGTGSDLKTKLGLDMVNPSLGPGAFKRTLDDLKLALEAKRRNLSGPGMMGPYGASAGAPSAPAAPATGGLTPTLRFNPATGKVEPIGR